MKKKAELFADAIERLKDAVIAVELEKIPIPDFVKLYPNDARVLLEALESLRWVAVYESDERNEIGREYIKFEDADYIGRLAEGVDYLETVGIIRLKDESDEN